MRFPVKAAWYGIWTHARMDMQKSVQKFDQASLKRNLLKCNGIEDFQRDPKTNDSFHY